MIKTVEPMEVDLISRSNLLVKDYKFLQGTTGIFNPIKCVGQNDFDHSGWVIFLLHQQGRVL